MTTSRVEGLSLVAVERKVEEIWKDVLGMSEGQESATFFELRGESISAVRLVSRVEDELGVLVDIADIFEEDPDLPAFTREVVAKAQVS